MAADVPTNNDLGTDMRGVQVTEHRERVKITVQGFSTFHMELNINQLTPDRLNCYIGNLADYCKAERTDVNVIKAHNCMLSSFLDIYAVSKKRHGANVFNDADEIGEINSAALNTQ